MGYVKNVTRVQTAFYKHIPSDEDKEKVVEIVGNECWDMYMYAQMFKEADTLNITVSQHNRLLLAAENKEELESIGITPRSAA